MDSETKGMMVTEVAVTDKEIKVTWTDANGDVKRVSSEDMPTKEFEEQLIKMAELLGKHLVLPEGRIKATGALVKDDVTYTLTGKLRSIRAGVENKVACALIVDRKCEEADQLRVWNAEEVSEIEELLYLAGRYAMGERFNAQPDLFGEIVEVDVEDKE